MESKLEREMLAVATLNLNITFISFSVVVQVVSVTKQPCTKDF